MKIVSIRRISQGFFLLVFLWFCVVTALGEKWWQLRGWPVNWIIQLDPLVGIGTVLTTHSLYAGLLWGMATVLLTIVLGRFFCGWVCPFGTIHQFVGFLGKKKKPLAEKIKVNRYRRWQSIKYWLFIFLLTAAIADLTVYLINLPQSKPWIFLALVVICLLGIAILASLKLISRPKRAVLLILGVVVLWTILSLIFKGDKILAASLQTGLLDPIPLLHRSMNLVLLPLIDETFLKISVGQRFYPATWIIGAIFLIAVFLNLLIPRFYCRFICPLGAFFGVLGRFALWRVGKIAPECSTCMVCEANCEGACEPSSQIRISECVLCMNCLHTCKDDFISYRALPSASGEVLSPDLSRRELVLSIVSGVAAIPMIRLNGNLGPNWNPKIIRPPGALAEEDFLCRCIKCGQCMRVCPTNVIHPAGLVGGLEGLWTPVLNFRVGTSGCQLNCIACGNVCPTAAIRPISLDEKLGKGQYTNQGRIKIGTAFVDRGRCLPWAMDKPCIVCQENCPVSPKAIFTQEHVSPVRINGSLRVKAANSLYIQLEGETLEPDQFSTGDYYCKVQGQTEIRPRAIVKNTDRSLMVSSRLPWETPPKPGSRIEILVRLQRPFVDPELCTGCGICEHECPVRGRRAIRVTADNESRSRRHSMLLKH